MIIYNKDKQIYLWIMGEREKMEKDVYSEESYRMEEKMKKWIQLNLSI